MKILNEALTGKLFRKSKSFNLLLVLVDMREGFCLYQARSLRKSRDSKSNVDSSVLRNYSNIW